MTAQEDYLSGKQLYGDDLDHQGILQWYEDEKEGYAGLVKSRSSTYRYPYHALNQLRGFAYLPTGPIGHALGVGSAYGDEFLPIKDRVRRVTIIEPSTEFTCCDVHGIPASYVVPDPSGNLPFDNDTFDLLTCLGVLHHIPNVSHVLHEFYRCLKPGSLALVREPIVSMGDWTKPRPRLTKHERGIPKSIFRQIVTTVGFEIVASHYCVFPPFVKLWRLTRSGGVFESSVATRVDGWLANLFSINASYHATSVWGKLRPASLYLVLRKDS